MKYWALLIPFLLTSPALASEPSEKSEQIITLPDVTITANREYPVQAGILGTQEKDALPLSISSLPVPKSEPSGNGLGSVLSLDSEVRVKGATGMNEVRIRGFNTPMHDFLIDGIPGLVNPSSLSLHPFASVEVVKGPATLLMGSSTFGRSFAGTVNLIPKKAEGNETDLSVSTTDKGGSDTSLDFSHRSKDGSAGIRVISSYTNTPLYSTGEKLRRKEIFVNTDIQRGKTSGNLFVGYSDTDHKSPKLPLMVLTSSLPSLSSARQNLQSPITRFQYTETLIGFNVKHEIKDNLSVWMKGGYFEDDWNGMEPMSPMLMDDEGTYLYRFYNTPVRYKRASITTGLSGSFKTGDWSHDWTIALDRQWLMYEKTYLTGDLVNYLGNIYTGSIAQVGVRTNYVYGPQRNQISSGISLVDTMKNDRWTFLFGFRHQEDNASAAENGIASHSSENAPTIGAEYKVNDRLSFYAHRMEGILGGSLVGPAHRNAGAYLDPVHATEVESGIRFSVKNMNGSLSYFRLNGQIPTTNAAQQYIYDGEQRSEGLTLALSGNVNEKLSLLSSFTWMDVENESGSNAGKKFHGSPSFLASLLATYKENEKLTLWMRGYFSASSYADDANTKKLSSWMTWDLGASYALTKNVTLHGEVDNLLNEKYWYSAGNNSVLYGEGRRALVTVNYKF